MSTLSFCLLFPFVLAIHNADEYRDYDEFVRIYHGGLARRFITRPVVRNATILLTSAGVILGVLTWAYQSPVLVDASIIASLALMLNAFCHIAVSLKECALTPGTRSAVLLVLPYSLLLIRAARLPWVTLLRFTGLGLAVMPLAVIVFLLLGYLLLSLSGPRCA